MGKLKKLSKSTPTLPSFEVLPYVRKDGTTVWLWACDQGCYSAEKYDKTSRIEAERVAQRHISSPH